MFDKIKFYVFGSLDSFINLLNNEKISTTKKRAMIDYYVKPDDLRSTVCWSVEYVSDLLKRLPSLEDELVQYLLDSCCESYINEYKSYIPLIYFNFNNSVPHPVIIRNLCETIADNIDSEIIANNIHTCSKYLNDENYRFIFECCPTTSLIGLLVFENLNDYCKILCINELEKRKPIDNYDLLSKVNFNSLSPTIKERFIFFIKEMNNDKFITDFVINNKEFIKHSYLSDFIDILIEKESSELNKLIEEKCIPNDYMEEVFEYIYKKEAKEEDKDSENKISYNILKNIDTSSFFDENKIMYSKLMCKIASESELIEFCCNNLKVFSENKDIFIERVLNYSRKRNMVSFTIKLNKELTSNEIHEIANKLTEPEDIYEFLSNVKNIDQETKKMLEDRIKKSNNIKYICLLALFFDKELMKKLFKNKKEMLNYMVQSQMFGVEELSEILKKLYNKNIDFETIELNLETKVKKQSLSMKKEEENKTKKGKKDKK